MLFSAKKNLTLAEGSWYEKLEIKLKIKVYTVMHQVLQVKINSPSFYKLLIFVEALQFFWYCIHPLYPFGWSSGGLIDYPRQVTKYLELDDIFRQNGNALFIAAVYLVFGLNLFMVLCLMIVLFKLEAAKKKASTILIYALQILSFYGMFLKTIAVIPLIQAVVPILVCRATDPYTTFECYNGTNIIHFIASLVAFVLTIFFGIVFNLLYIELSPGSNAPFAAPQSYISLLKFFLKVGVSFYIMIDYQSLSAEGFIIIYSIVWLIILTVRYNTPPLYNDNIQTHTVLGESVVFWGTLCSIFQAFVNSGDISVFYLLILGPFMGYTYVRICERRKFSYMKKDLNSFIRAKEVEMYILIALSLIDQKEHSDKKMQIEGLLRYHVRKAGKNEDSLALELALDTSSDDDSMDGKKKWYTFVKLLLMHFLENQHFSKSSRLRLLYAYIQHEKLKNKYKALYEMMVLEDLEPNLQEEFSAFRHKMLIEKEMFEEDLRNNESKGLDLNGVIEFQNNLVYFQKEIEKAVVAHLDFWRELLEEQPNILKLQELGSKISTQVELVTIEFNKIYEINPNHIKLLSIYGNFLQDILNDESEGPRLLEKAEYIEKSARVTKKFLDNDRAKYGENSSTCIITCSGNNNTLGVIDNINHEITRILQYNKSDLVGQNISRIMPLIYSEIHDKLMMNYFESSKGSYVGRDDRIVYPIDRTGYLFPCTLFIKVMPNLENGIQVVGFLREKDPIIRDPLMIKYDTHYILFGGDDRTIQAVSYSLFKSMGVSSAIANGRSAAINEFTIDSLIPGILEQTDEDLKSPNGVILEIDTSNFETNFLMNYIPDDDDSKAEHIDEDAIKARYRKAQVRVHLIEDKVHEGRKVRVVQLNEIQEAGIEKLKSNESEDKNLNRGESKNGAGNANFFDNEGQSEMSSYSVSSTAQDDKRQLKDFKALISEKTNPFSIKWLNRTTIILILFLIAITAVELNQKGSYNDEISANFLASLDNYKRLALAGELNYKTRILKLLADDLILPRGTTAEFEAQLKQEMDTLDTQLKNIQYEIVQSDVIMLNTLDKSANSLETYEVMYKLRDGAIVKSSEIYNALIYEFVGSVQNIKNNSMELLNANTLDESTATDFYFIRENGLGVLRKAGTQIAETRYQFNFTRLDDYNSLLLAIMISSICVLFIVWAIITPIIFSVYQINTKVLSLFGYISPNEISELATKCEKYLSTYLEDHSVNSEYSESHEEEEDDAGGIKFRPPSKRDNSYMEISMAQSDIAKEAKPKDINANRTDYSVKINHQKKLSEVGSLLAGADNSMTPFKQTTEYQSKLEGDIGSPHLDDNKDVSQMIMSGTQPNDNSYINQSKDLKEQLKTEMPLVKNKEILEKERAKEKADEEYAEFLEKRSKQLRNSKENNRSKLTVQISVFIILIICYFVGNYINEKSYIDNIKFHISHLKYLSSLLSDTQYVMIYALEELAENNLTVVYPDLTTNVQNNNHRIDYVNLVYADQKFIQADMIKSFSSNFDSYISLLKTYSNQNLCTSFYAGSTAINCPEIASGTLTKGLIYSIVSIMQLSQGILDRFYKLALADRTPAVQSSLINDDVFDGSMLMLEAIIPVMNSLIDSFSTSFNDYLDSIFIIAQLKFILFLAVIFMIYLFLWLPYLRNLSSRIFRTKGMLNMIPMEIISKNELLKDLFIHGDLINAVK